MNVASEKLLLQLSGKDAINEVSVDELTRITKAHPYFSIGHLFLAQKLKAIRHNDYPEQLQRTAVYFHHPLWLNFLLEDGLVNNNSSLAAEVNPAADQPPSANEASHLTATQLEKTGAAIIVAETDEAQYEANTTEEVMQQAQDEEKQKEVIASVLEEQLAEFKKPVTTDTELKIETEPYHTVDYFASQGIKVDLTQPQDRLGTQVRKFTDWLKQMKNVKSEASDLGTDPEVENMIQGIAKTSNETKEIVTETMAQVLVKQGKTDKAIQLYIKLSFLNPDKSAYFAGKIEQLKGI